MLCVLLGGCIRLHFNCDSEVPAVGTGSTISNYIIPSPLSAERDNSRQLAGGNARARNSEGIILIVYNTFRFRLEGV